MTAVRVTRSCSVYWNYVPEQLAEGQEIPAGQFADHLLATGAPVEAVDPPVEGDAPPVEDDGPPAEEGGPDGNEAEPDPPHDPPVAADVPELSPSPSPGDADVGGDVALVMQVPDGPVFDVLTWVGNDLERAAAALTAEQARDKPRTTLVAALTNVTR